jgi:hypothetical protein
VEQRHDAADYVLCVVSDDYLKPPYSTLERNAALWQAASKTARLRFIPGGEVLAAADALRSHPLRTVRHYRGCGAPALSLAHV